MPTERGILEIILTQHWDMKACECWVCVAARENGIRPQDYYLNCRMPKVRVADEK